MTWKEKILYLVWALFWGFVALAGGYNVWMRKLEEAGAILLVVGIIGLLATLADCFLLGGWWKGGRT